MKTEQAHAKAEKPAFMLAPRCGAKTRKGTPCQAPAMRGKKRCRMHGGKSTGPKIPYIKHGNYTKAAREEAKLVRELIKASSELMEGF